MISLHKTIPSRIILLWLLAPTLLFLPLAWIDPIIFFGNSDALFYTNILNFVSDSLRKGELFPRWFADANSGFGSPVMLFYAPFAYNITALITLPLIPLHLSADGQLVVGLYASQVVSGYTSFLWLRRSFSQNIACVGSLFFVLLPYKIVYIYLHVNLAQLWALAMLPLWMIAAGKILTNDRRAVVFYGLVFAAVYYMHPLTVIAFGAVPACYVLWFGGKKNCAFICGKLALAHLLGLGLCSMQLLPQQAYLSWIHAEEFLKDKYSWRENLYHVDVVLCAYYGIVAMLVGYAIHKIPAIRKEKFSSNGRFWIVVMVVVLFMTQRPSTFIWEFVTPLQYLQFPAARLHAAALMAVTYLLCIWLTIYTEARPFGPVAYHKATLTILIVGFGIATILYIHQVNTDPVHYNQDYIGESYAAKILPEPHYLTRWGCIDPGQALRLYRNHEVPANVTVEAGKADIHLRNWQLPEDIVLDTNIYSKEATLLIRQCYVPLWEARDETGQRIVLSPSEGQGLIKLTLPQGTHTVRLVFTEGPVQKMGRFASLFALLLCLGWIVINPRRANIAEKI